MNSVVDSVCKLMMGDCSVEVNVSVTSETVAKVEVDPPETVSLNILSVEVTTTT